MWPIFVLCAVAFLCAVASIAFIFELLHLENKLPWLVKVFVLLDVMFILLAFALKYRADNYDGRKYLRSGVMLMENVHLVEECREIPYDIDPCEVIGIIDMRTGERHYVNRGND